MMGIEKDHIVEIVYENPKVRRSARAYLNTTLFITLVIGGLAALLWCGFILSDTPNPELFSASNPGLGDLLVISIIVLFSIAGGIRVVCSLSPMVVAVKDGLFIYSGVKRRFYLPWSNIAELTYCHRKSMLNPRGDYVFISIHDGLTLFHLKLRHIENGGWTLRRGFELLASGAGYSELVQSIILHLEP